MVDRIEQLLLCYRYCRARLGFSRWDSIRLAIALHGSETFRAHLRAKAVIVEDIVACTLRSEGKMIPDLAAIDYVNRLVAAEIARERERCALLCELKGIHAVAAEIRRGTGPRVREPEEGDNDER
jgi:hypothetical protein